MRTLESAAAKRYLVTIETPADPTGSAVEFAVVPATATSPSSWVAGNWQSAWSSTTSRVQALTPLIGTGQALNVTEGQDYRVYMRWQAGGDTPVELADTLRVK